MSHQLVIKSTSMLPEALSHILATPSSTEVEQLFWRYQQDYKNLCDTDAFLRSGKFNGSIGLLLQSAMNDVNQPVVNNVSGRDLNKAIQLLQQNYWGKAVDITDVLEHMPQRRRGEWRESLKKFEFPEFTLEHVYETLSALLSERDKFFAEYVDGIFRELSGEHVTNSPSGFGQKFIIAYVHEDGYPNSDKCGYISDLRRVIAKFMKRDVNERQGRVDTYNLIRLLYRTGRTGEWVEIDGGSIRLKTFKKGTVHIEVSSELAWQLNEVLSILYPRAIPSEFRTKKAKKTKEVHLSQNLLGFDVIYGLSTFEQAYKPVDGCFRGRHELIPNTYHLRYSFDLDKHLLRKIYDVIRAVGGVDKKSVTGYFEFDYDPMPVIEQITILGSIPDKYSHQFYPTPESVGDKMVSKLGVLPGDNLLEPSAGIGNLAGKLKGNVTCVEVSKMHCNILKSKGFDDVHCADFLVWAEYEFAQAKTYSGIVMNPPFSLGRAEAHVEAALTLLDNNGTLVALVPSAVANKLANTHTGMKVDIEPLSQDAFRGVSIELSIMTIINS